MTVGGDFPLNGGGAWRVESGIPMSVMKLPTLLVTASLVFFLIPSCDRDSSETARRLAELERQNQEAVARQAELEQQLADQKLAAEMEAIERERASIEEDRAELEKQAGEAAAEQETALREREAEMATRERKLEQLRGSLEEKEDALGTRENQLTARDREQAGREALNPEPSELGEPVGDYGTFHQSLSAYGSWFETADYGYVWQPAVVREAGWRPYSRGRWVCSDRGWTWISEEPFGWATYHYGRWALLNGRGWIWVPGSEWAPSWVSWREGGSHIGWAPLPPETLAWRGGGWDSTVDVQFGIGAAWFTFVDVRNFGGPLYRHCLPVSGNAGWYGSTTNITYIHVRNQQVICGGPRYDRISERIGRPLPFYRLEVDRHPRFDRDRGAPRPTIHGGRLRVSAPNLDAQWNEGMRPSRVKGRIEQVNVVRERQLAPEIRERFRQSQTEERQRAEKAIENEGGRERFEEKRRGKVIPGRLSGREDNRGTSRQESAGNRDAAGQKKSPEPGRVDVKPVPKDRLPEDRVPRQPKLKDGPAGRGKGYDGAKNPLEILPKPRVGRDRATEDEQPGAKVTPPPPRREDARDSVKRPQTQRENSRESGNLDRQRQDATRKIQQQKTNELRKSSDDAAERQQAELARQRQENAAQRQEIQTQDARKQAQAKQDRQKSDARDEAAQRQLLKQQENQKEAQRFEQAQQQQQREAGRQQQAEQQSEALKQQELQLQERQQKERQQEELQQQKRQQQERQQQERQQQERQQQEQSRQRDQAREQQESSRQQEQSKRQEQSRQQEERNREDSGRRNR